VRRNIVSRYKHPKFDPDTLMYNYMILKLDEKVDTLPHVWIDPTIEIPTDAELFVVGYGFTASRIQINHIYEDTFHHTVLDTTEILRYGNDDGPTSRMQGSDLQKIEANIVPHGICNANDQYAGFVDDKTMICANNEDGDCKFLFSFLFFFLNSPQPLESNQRMKMLFSPKFVSCFCFIASSF
ncbi:MAG: hypothetical protein ACI8RD_014576, partial [Bacillariaceae sp.]|jgi:hypothetical protein